MTKPVNKNSKIMLIDDNPGELIILKAALTRINQDDIQLEAFQNPLEALERIKTLLKTEEGKAELPNLIFLDISMPEMSGIELLTIFKKIEALRIVPIIIITTSELDTELEGCYKHHANSVMLKPMDFEDYVDMLEISLRYWLHSSYLPTFC